jgi:3-methyladenine DNA glycosylase AlkD
MANINKIKKELRDHSDPVRAKALQRFFKTNKGEYGYGDIFLGITVPEIRKLVKKNGDVGIPIIEQLIKSKIHEERLLAILILVEHYQRASDSEKITIARFYLSHRQYINNWDLIDLSAHKIIGSYLFDKPKKILYKLVVSKNIWDRRIAILSTFYFIKNNKFTDSLKMARILLLDDHDLIQKAVGWMLREIGKRSIKTEEEFLKKYYKVMPRTMLRYAIEKFPEERRLAYLNNAVRQ